MVPKLVCRQRTNNVIPINNSTYLIELSMYSTLRTAYKMEKFFQSIIDENLWLLTWTSRTFVFHTLLQDIYFDFTSQNIIENRNPSENSLLWKSGNTTWFNLRLWTTIISFDWHKGLQSEVKYESQKGEK